MSVYAIMLDKWLEVFPDRWPVTATGTSPGALRRRGQHSDKVVLRPRAAHRAEFLENKSLINARSGQVDTGGLYKLL
jgi:hypothetical protein